MQENIDTTSSGGRLVFHLFGALAEFERNLIRARGQTRPCGTRLAPPGHSQLILVRANGMQVDMDECRFIRS